MGQINKHNDFRFFLGIMFNYIPVFYRFYLINLHILYIKVNKMHITIIIEPI